MRSPVSLRGYVAVFFLSLGTFFVFLLPARAADPNLAKAIREAAAQAPLLEPFTPGEPKYQVFRLNTAVVSHRGQRYSVIRLRIPAGPRQPLVWMFALLLEVDQRQRGARWARPQLRLLGAGRLGRRGATRRVAVRGVYRSSAPSPISRPKTAAPS